MDAREERGLIIAATCRLNRMSDGTYLVPSQTKGARSPRRLVGVRLAALRKNPGLLLLDIPSETTI